MDTVQFINGEKGDRHPWEQKDENSQQIYYCEALWTVNRPKCGTLGLGKENENLGEESKCTKEE